MSKAKTGISISKSVSTPVLGSAEVSAKKPTGITVVKKAAVVLEGFTEAHFTELSGMSDLQKAAKIDELIKSNTDNARLSLCQILNRNGLLSTEGAYLVNTTNEKVQSSDAVTKEVGLRLLHTLVRHVGRGTEPFVAALFPALLAFHADRSASVRDLAALIIKDFLEVVCPFAFREHIYPFVRSSLTDEDWRVKVGALLAIKAIAPRTSPQMSPLLPDIIPLVSECILDAKKQVQTAGIDALVVACRSIGNDDIRPLVPQLVSVIARPDESEKTLNLLLETTFVANVDAPVLALIAPLLGKSLKNRSSVMKRKASRVIDIMCRLVQNPSDVAPFVPLLLPSLDKVIDELVDAEVCDVAKAARAVLLGAMGEGRVTKGAAPTVRATSSMDLVAVKAHLARILAPLVPADPSDTLTPLVAEYAASMAAQLLLVCPQTHPSLGDAFPLDDLWRAAVATTPIADLKNCIAPYLRLVFGHSSAEEDAPESRIFSALRVAALGEVSDNQFDAAGDDASLCNIEFSLAFGGKILLHNTFLRLGRGRRYGLLGTPYSTSDDRFYF